MPFAEQRALHSPTGAMLNLYHHPVRGKPRGVVQINHGLAEHAARYDRFAEALVWRGYHVYAHDHRGHGYTVAPDAPLGVFGWKNGGQKVLDDISAVHDLIRQTHGDLPLVTFGHSMGAIITANFIQQRSEGLAGAAICNGNLNAGALGWLARAILGYERFRRGSDQPSHILPRLTFQAWGKAVPNHRTPFDWLSRDPVEVDKYIADPLCGWDASVSLWRDLFGFIFSGANDKSFKSVARDLPIHLVGGENDPATDGGKAVTAFAERLTAMGFSNLVSRIYAETRHESLNEINREEITTNLIDWFDTATAARRGLS